MSVILGSPNIIKLIIIFFQLIWHSDNKVIDIALSNRIAHKTHIPHQKLIEFHSLIIWEEIQVRRCLLVCLSLYIYTFVFVSLAVSSIYFILHNEWMNTPTHWCMCIVWFNYSLSIHHSLIYCITKPQICIYFTHFKHLSYFIFFVPIFWAIILSWDHFILLFMFVNHVFVCIYTDIYYNQ